MKINASIQIAPSATVAMNTLAQQKRTQGVRVYNLSAGEPILPTHPAILRAATEAIQDGRTLYPPLMGIGELRDAASAWMNRIYGTQYSSADTVVTCGGKFGIFSSLQALLEVGDEVIIIAPYWVSYPSMVKMFGGLPNIIDTQEANHWKVSPESIEQKISSKTKILIFNNGTNPTGVLYSRQETSEILALAAKHNLTVISDEVYSGLTYDQAAYVSCGSFPEYRDRVIVIQSCSKHFAMTGWRVGFLFGPPQIVEAVVNIQAQSTSGTSSISQWAAVAAFAQADEIVDMVRGAMQIRRDTCISACREYFFPDILSPQSALYAFISLSHLGVKDADSTAFCRRAITEADIAIVPGAAFGAEGYVRFAFGAGETELTAGIAALARFIGKF